MNVSRLVAAGSLPVRGTGAWARLVLGLAVAYPVLQGIATGLGSDRGQAGPLIAAVVIATLLFVEWAFFATPPVPALRHLGFGRPLGTGLVVALAVSLLLVLVLPAFASLTRIPLPLHQRWLAPALGLLAQAGIAEEALFRGYLFGHLRLSRTFWQAAALSMVPFVGVHLILFAIMPPVIATAAVVLAALTSFPLARLYELGGRTIWAPALLHAMIQGAIKLVEIPPAATPGLPLVWMAAAAIIPYAVFLVPVRRMGPTEGRARTRA